MRPGAVAPTFGLGKRLLLITGTNPAPLGHQPDLEEVDGLAVRGVVLAVGDARTGTHALDLPRADHVAGPMLSLCSKPPSSTYERISMSR
jgi:hypothetical protein